MIPEKIKIEILTPERTVYAEEVSSIRLPGAQGYFGVFPGHTPYISVLGIGEIKVEQDGKKTYFATSGGVAEVLPGGVSVLAETCEPAQSIDVKRAEAAKKRAQQRLEEGRKDWDMKRVQVSLTRAINRMKVASA